MPEGLQYAISAKLSDNPRISVVASEAGPSLFVERYIQETIGSCLELGTGFRAYIHLVLFSHDSMYFQMPSYTDATAEDITIYDYVSQPCAGIESLYKAVVKNVLSRPGRTHFMIIDDYSLFSVLCTARDTRRQRQFMRAIGRHVRKTYLYFHKDTMSTEEVGMLYAISSDIAFLTMHPDSYGTNGTVCTYNSKFNCDLLKIREDKKVTHDRTIFQVTEDELTEELIHDTEKSANDDVEVLKNLTTFKLTLEEGEKESKNKLHLPYFDAQKTTLQDPEIYDDFEDDEDDEEI